MHHFLGKWEAIVVNVTVIKCGAENSRAVTAPLVCVVGTGEVAGRGRLSCQTSAFWEDGNKSLPSNVSLVRVWSRAVTSWTLRQTLCLAHFLPPSVSWKPSSASQLSRQPLIAERRPGRGEERRGGVGDKGRWRDNDESLSKVALQAQGKLALILHAVSAPHGASGAVDQCGSLAATVLYTVTRLLTLACAS